jgi:hypothetical protein
MSEGERKRERGGDGEGVRGLEFVTRKGDLLLSPREGALLLASRRINHSSCFG